MPLALALALALAAVDGACMDRRGLDMTILPVNRPVFFISRGATMPLEFFPKPLPREYPQRAIMADTAAVVDFCGGG